MQHDFNLRKGVQVYFNLTRKTFSIRGFVPGAGWRVMGHADSLVLQAVRPHVSEAGRQRVVETGVRNIHAYLSGLKVFTENPEQMIKDKDLPTRITYNPFKGPGFVAITEDFGVLPFTYADYVFCETVNGRPLVRTYRYLG